MEATPWTFDPRVQALADACSFRLIAIDRGLGLWFELIDSHNDKVLDVCEDEDELRLATRDQARHLTLKLCGPNRTEADMALVGRIEAAIEGVTLRRAA